MIFSTKRTAFRKILAINIIGVSLLISLLFSLSSAAQTHEIDSLKQILQKEKTDTVRILILTNLAYQFLELNPNTALTYTKQGLELAKDIDDKKWEALCLNRMGNVYTVLGNYSKALSVSLEALKINEKISNLSGLQETLNIIGIIYKFQGESHLALAYYFKALKIAEQLKDKVSLSKVLINTAVSYMELKMYDSATLFIQQANLLAKQIDYKKGIGTTFGILGNIYFETGQYNLVIEYERLSFPYLQETGGYLHLSTAYLITANAFNKIKQNDSALFYARQALLVAKERDLIPAASGAAEFLSTYYRKYNTDSAFFYIDIAKALSDSTFSQEKQQNFQKLTFAEELRQQEMEEKKIKDEEKRKHNLQYLAIAVGIITFIIFFFLFSRSIIVGERFIKFFGILGLLAVFEFINMFIHPLLANLTNDSPPLMLGILMIMAAMLIPLHHKLEHWITYKVTEKNKNIRLAAAKKTIEKLKEIE
jgi:tetratricopeptide (TPR) repeat protein